MLHHIKQNDKNIVKSQKPVDGQFAYGNYGKMYFDVCRLVNTIFKDTVV
jgi:hypothetical protein